MARSEDCEGLQKVPELTVPQAQMKKREAEKDKQKNNKKKKKKVVGLSTQRMEEKTSKREFADAEDMVQWRSMNHEGLSGNS